MRQLTHIEQAFTYSNEVNPLCVVIVMRTLRAPAAAALRRALDNLQQRHILLRCGIVDEDGSYGFRLMEPHRPIPLLDLDRRNESHWEEIAERELNTRFDVAGPLVRMIRLTGTEESDLILVLHHAIMDGVSARLLLHELLNLFNSRQLSPPLPKADQVAGHAFPAEYRRRRLMLKLIPFVAQQTWNEITFRLRGIVTPAAASPDNRVLHLCLPPNVSRRINVRLGREGLSLNAAISAALLLAARRTLHPTERRRLMRAISFVDLRSTLDPPPVESVLGCMISMLRATVAVRYDDDLITVAQRLKREIFSAGKLGGPFLMAVSARHLTRLALRMRVGRIANSALSFLGELDLEPTYGDMQLVDVHAFITNNVVGPEISGFGKVLFGRIELDLTYLASEISEATARELLSEIEVSLRDIAQ